MAESRPSSAKTPTSVPTTMTEPSAPVAFRANFRPSREMVDHLVALLGPPLSVYGLSLWPDSPSNCSSRLMRRRRRFSRLVDHEVGGRAEVLGELCLLLRSRRTGGDGARHVSEPTVAFVLTDGEWGVAHPQPRMAALVRVRPGPAPVLHEEEGQPPALVAEVAGRIEGPEDGIDFDTSVEVVDEFDEEGLAADSIEERGRHPENATEARTYPTASGTGTTLNSPRRRAAACVLNITITWSTWSGRANQ